MPRVDRRREVMSSPPGAEYWKQRTEEGWRLVAVEWEREVEAAAQEPKLLREEAPFGLRVADDCRRLEEDSTEKEILLVMMELIVQDSRLTRIAEELNGKGFRTRQGAKWGPVAVLNLLPRLIEVGPQIFSSEEWIERRQRLFSVAR